MASTGRATSPLLAMPAEVLLHITKYLTTEEFGDMRLTCKHMEASLLSQFSSEFFQRRQFMFTEFSLQTFIDISQSRFGPAIAYLNLGVERVSIAAYQQFDQMSQEDAIKHNKAREVWATTQFLLDSGEMTDMLTEGLANLPNLQSVSLRDFSSPGRYRDSPHAEWRSYGTRTLTTVTNAVLEYPASFGFNNQNMDLMRHARRLWIMILRALSRVPADRRPQSLEVLLRSTSLADVAFNIPERLLPAIGPVLANLDSLFLSFNSRYHSAVVLCMDRENKRCDTPFLQKMVGQATNLKHLRLNFMGGNFMLEGDLLGWLSRLPSSADATSTVGTGGTTLPSPIPAVLRAHSAVELRKLDKLEIGMADCSIDVLLDLMKTRGPQLRHISLHRTTLRDYMGDDGNVRVNVWAKFLLKMSKLPLGLHSFVIREPRQGACSQNGQRAMHSRYPAEFKESDGSSRQASWRGTDVSRALRELGNVVTVQWPPEQSNDDSDEGLYESGSEGEDDGDDEEMDDE